MTSTAKKAMIAATVGLALGMGQSLPRAVPIRHVLRTPRVPPPDRFGYSTSKVLGIRAQKRRARQIERGILRVG